MGWIVDRVRIGVTVRDEVWVEGWDQVLKWNGVLRFRLCQGVGEEV